MALPPVTFLPRWVCFSSSKTCCQSAKASPRELTRPIRTTQDSSDDELMENAIKEVDAGRVRFQGSFHRHRRRLPPVTQTVVFLSTVNGCKFKFFS
ncbi:hypothetical protein NC652_019900 [Populus alba x Populus x berolinensis]|nr:hypothetical protein NC652_019900 [Populus alba x Populus x berolinensis]